MTKEEIAKYAYPPLSHPNRLILTFKDKTKEQWIGFFGTNPMGILKTDNNWNFVPFKDNPLKENKLFNGDDLEMIQEGFVTPE